jgi:hypothetical protein
MNILRACIALVLASFFTVESSAENTHYYLKYEFDKTKALACDHYVREYSSYYKSDMKSMIEAYTKKDAESLSTILAKYGMRMESDTFLKNDFVSAVLTCSSVYVFNEDVNYWREFMKEMSLLMLKVNTTLNISGKYNDSVYEIHDDAMYSLNIILQSENKLLTRQ